MLVNSSMVRETALAGANCEGCPISQLFCIYQDRSVKFNRHIVHEKRNKTIPICLGQLNQGSGNG